VKFKHFFPLWAAFWVSLFCVGIYYDGVVSWWFPQPVQSTGSVKVVDDGYLLHKTIEYQNGDRVEFYLCSTTPALDVKGQTVIITYRDRWDNFSRCKEVESVRIQATRAAAQEGNDGNGDN
jgi:hypothetical protein